MLYEVITMVGTAPEADYWLLRSEDEYSENLVEQDYWAAAIEFADSAGVDLVNTSLGYYAFDDQSKNYEYRNLNGQYALMSRQAWIWRSATLSERMPPPTGVVSGPLMPTRSYNFV